MAIIFFHNEDQEKAALKSKAGVKQRLDAPIYTEIQPFVKFYLAEDYHQKYYLQGRPQLSGEIRAYYPDFGDFINSTTAARINGILAGYGDAELVAEEISAYGLSSRSMALLQSLFD